MPYYIPVPTYEETLQDPNWYIDCQVCGGRIYGNQERIQPIGGPIYCVKCWKEKHVQKETEKIGL